MWNLPLHSVVIISYITTYRTADGVFIHDLCLSKDNTIVGDNQDLTNSIQQIQH